MPEIVRDGGSPTARRCPRKTNVAKARREYKLKASSRSGSGKFNQVVSLMVLGGVIELIGVWNQDGDDDGFDPFLKNSVREQGDFSMRSGIFRLADRRAPVGAPYEYMPSPQKQRKRNGDPFARHWYMRLVSEGQDSVAVREKIVRSVCHVSSAVAGPVALVPVVSASGGMTSDSCLSSRSSLRSSSARVRPNSASSGRRRSIRRSRLPFLPTPPEGWSTTTWFPSTGT